MNRKPNNATAVVILRPLKVQLMGFFTCTGTTSYVANFRVVS